jgi:ABC-type lipoprotein release transport system permease subunit
MDARMFGPRCGDLRRIAVVRQRSALIAGVSLLASFPPARRAAALDPMQVLRSE